MTVEKIQIHMLVEAVKMMDWLRPPITLALLMDALKVRVVCVSVAGVLDEDRFRPAAIALSSLKAASGPLTATPYSSCPADTSPSLTPVRLVPLMLATDKT